MRAAGVGKDFKENPNLRDNWTDAEGYYSKFCPIVSPFSLVANTPETLTFTVSGTSVLLQT